MRIHSSSKDLEALYEAFLNDSTTPLTRLNVWIKLALLALILIVAFFSGNPLGLLALASATLVVLAISRKPRTIVNCVLGLRYLLVIIVAVTAIVEYLRGYSLTALLIDPLTMSLRVVLLLTVLSAVSSALTLKEVIEVADRLGIPKYIAYSFILALRFIPLILHDMNEVSASLKLKGISLSEGGLRARLKVLRYLLTSLVIITDFRRFKVAEAIEVRGLLEE
ncbi:MAG: energy-coupling factor transporter transmembrane protein EcfT [Caldisphaeraceae archaeon]|nr:energy-coupling factor transporter transmembrane protein EcfT [Caldisphaeraceae archaeon]